MIKNLIATLFLSLGVPMLLSGDEFRRTQKGNNNSYCQDNEISWINWDLLTSNREIFEFTKKMIEFRKKHPILRSTVFFTGTKGDNYTTPDISWHGTEISMPEWEDDEPVIAVLINGQYAEESSYSRDSDFYMIFNASDEDLTFKLPGSPSGKQWKISIDTQCGIGNDIFVSDIENLVEDESIISVKRSVLVLTT